MLKNKIREDLAMLAKCSHKILLLPGLPVSFGDRGRHKLAGELGYLFCGNFVVVHRCRVNQSKV